MQSYNPADNSYEGFETWTNALKMQRKMHARLIGILLVMQFSLFVLSCQYTATYETYVLSRYIKAKVFRGSPRVQLTLRGQDGTVTHPTAYAIASSAWIQKAAAAEFKRLALNWLKLFAAVFLTYPLLVKAFKRRSRKQSSKRYIRGARLITPEQLLREFEQRRERLDLPLGSIKMPVALENRQTMTIGKPGSGKTQALRPILKRLIERGERGIVYDNKGDYFSEFFDPEKDLLFNPLDRRSLGWNLFNELTSYPDVDAVAASLVPPPKAATDPFWNDAARGVFSGILHYLYQGDLRNNAELWRMLTADADEIARKLKSTKGGEAGYRYITQNAENSRQAESVLAVMMQYTKCFEYMAANEGAFRINEWLEGGRGFIYITNYDVIEETLRPILSLFIDLVGRKLLSMPDSDRRRIYFALDEFGSLQRLSTLINLLTKGRSKGACAFLGIQDDGQTEKIYTPQLRKSIDNACGNRITFALSGETAELEAKYNIGETEIVTVEKSLSMGSKDVRDGISLQEHRKRDLLFLASDIANLQDLSAIVRLKNYDFVLSKWSWQQPRQIHTPFLLRDDLLLENIVADQERVRQRGQRVVITEELNIAPAVA